MYLYHCCLSWYCSVTVDRIRKIYKGDRNMKPIIFCRIAEMEYYRGITDSDIPNNGGAYVRETGDAHECNNFNTVTMDNEEYCLGFVKIAGSSEYKDAELHLEKINGCKLTKNLDSVDDITVVWCAKAENSPNTRVVGFYQNATVFRYPQCIEFTNGEAQIFNFIAKKEDCVLLPRNERCTKS